MTACQQIVTSLLFFQVMVNLKESESQIVDVSSVTLTFSLTVTFYFTKNWKQH